MTGVSNYDNANYLNGTPKQMHSSRTRNTLENQTDLIFTS